MTTTQTLPTIVPLEQRGYTHPQVLVSTEWVWQHREDPTVRIVESDEDLLLYDTGHVPGAVKIDWIQDLNDPIIRDYLDHQRMQQLLRAKGISRDTTIVFYGDKNNWWACYAFWVLRLFGLENLRIMDGGRLLWEKERRPFTTERPTYAEGNITLPPRDDQVLRAFRDQVLAHLKTPGKLVDVRSPEEYRGERLHMPEYPNEGAVRGGHIPGAKNIPWARAVDPDTHTFKTAADLRKIYTDDHGLRTEDDVVAYCRIGERSSHTWFVLTYLLGFKKVRNYDGSWTEWGNSVGVPIEKP
jgi:thiosulfate/3-mercaptopyruvate sulfurtransferase